MNTHPLSIRTVVDITAAEEAGAALGVGGSRGRRRCAAERRCAEKFSASYDVVEVKTIRALPGHNGFSGWAVSRMNRRDLFFCDLRPEDSGLVSLNCRTDAVRDTSITPALALNRSWYSKRSYFFSA
jgi:hypothetical protein